MANRLDLNGIDGLLAELRRRGENAVKRVENKALKAAGQVMADDMIIRAPISELNKIHIKDNIGVSGVKRVDGKKFVLVGPKKRVKWRSHFSEFGTSNQQASPFIEPAFHAKKQEAMEIITDELRKGLRS